MSIYRKKIHIPYYDGDKDSHISPVNIIKYFTETSAEEGDSFVLEDQEIDYGWMLYRWKVSIKDYPKIKEDVVVETWVSKLDRFYAFREFVLLDREDNILAKASTVWLCIDMDRKRPIRIPGEYIEDTKILDQVNFSNFHDFQLDLEIDSYIDFKVRRSDIDYNQHVNNAEYLTWMIESMTEDIYKDYRISEFEIIYRKEIKYGDNISTGFITHSRRDGELEFIHSIRVSGDEEVNAFGKTKWIKKEDIKL